jgi:hypothetical protein
MQQALYLSCLQSSLVAFTYFFFSTKSLQSAKWLLGVDKRRVKRREYVDGCSFCKYLKTPSLRPSAAVPMPAP